ncbi:MULTISPECIES: NUDIX hydrolase [unclassified Streptomyces]|uniref:NUDIX hydrolase n=1 Tax=unclassified Streptomyces TaxID=2593676 RepID=UPI0022377505|nr:NUDIX domain-containing protein [Streptomyces sp. SHP 1-2]MCW5250852.1 NUDIX domain-containing protein [Streptomyces sp. SHP 1-2]
MRRLVARVWRALRPLQSRIMWCLNAKFVVGVTGVVRDGEGRVLLLRHRMWPPGRQWGLPSGFARKGEDFRGTLVREVKEETGLDVEAGALVLLTSGLRTRLEVAYEARLLGGELRPDPFEILEARWCRPDELPEEIQPVCRPLVRGETTP